ncbi:DEAD/DEAH box helicase [Novosphingobium sp. Fuku2-ISO-50]|jgi:ATP-dependent RNA helicase DeaD|uniref:DEAD/DEAH box helicase n=1 Tax=Novosphingobium sp. Fuku2-ISO-50 TaxID=1739114 RepID=UPI00076BFB00|nr:DEAD/DEAH box helicase [Novosphingobium sp. Fuku2-ISO-50]KUR74558.1 DEAD/DEAH box helicase [Novosphingobium sp. Fuku2-ISO-50]
MPFPPLPLPISEALTEQGYAEPTPVQAAVLAPEAQGRDLLVSAQTGSGKTVAFGLAMADAILSADMGPAARAPVALVIAPTRELALQVSRELMWLFAKAGVRITTCVGGMDASRERRALYQGTQIVVGTPGRLRDHLEHGALDLSSLRYVVLDEADEMLDMGFREDLEEILEATPGDRRSLLFSATMPKPIVALAKRYQQDALRISTVSETPGHGDISYQAVAVSPADIENAVINLLRFHEAETAILFCATRDNVRHLHSSLTERGFAAVALSGEHSQKERNAALQALRDGRARICVATDVAARGIDIPSLSLVIHVETPRDAEVLQHRSGRTGRAGRKGVAVLIVPYPRRRRVEGMLRMARVQAEWVPVPSAEAIRERDRERMLADLVKPVEASDADRALAEQIVDKMSPLDLALALVQARKHGIPEPEDLIEQSSGDGPVRPERRAGFEDVAWFRMDIGRRQNADPRWILPLLCRRGHITRNEIGAIRIAANETYFQVPTAVEAKFRAALKRTGTPGSEDENGITIEPSLEAPQDGGNDGPRQPRDNSAPRRRGPNAGPNSGPRGGANGGPGGGRPTLHRKGAPPRRRD